MNVQWGPSPPLESGWGAQAQVYMTEREQCRVAFEDWLTVWDTLCHGCECVVGSGGGHCEAEGV